MIFALTNEIIFPPVELSEENGILAVGGDLSPERLITAYSMGIFPWFSDDDPIVWWSPDPRFVLYPEEIKISRTMRQVLRRGYFDITFDRAFESVIGQCRGTRRGQKGTWITDQMMEAYIVLHGLGLAHSVEAWHDGKLAGGLYGVSLGRCFFGESMFALVPNASKAAFITLTAKLQSLNFPIIDCQVYTQHLESLGAREIPRSEFISSLHTQLEHDTLKGNWGTMSLFSEPAGSLST
ncbi:MAG: leucyl/phenylalanyl-tRNA--protein transferase [Spirochaetae bacterium HGW-Spirochaetae-1]|jgi:leucyl/phenylalanyl-tRNA--protein transferase|nr:MAG: leucyl/phenylalanyl-tRNA--protein transferase [Spirochaetae bacterium HGW-Spirochaetae-1]